MRVICSACKNEFEMPNHRVNFYHKNGYKIYCSKRCPERIKNYLTTDEEKRRSKCEYDYEYRKSNLSHIRQTQKHYRSRTLDRRRNYLDVQKYGPYSIVKPIIIELLKEIKIKEIENGKQNNKEDN